MRTEKIHCSEDAYRALVSDTFTGYDVKSKMLHLKYAPEDIVIDLTNGAVVEHFVNGLTEFIVTEQENSILTARYGFLSGNAKTLTETGQIWGFTDEYIRSTVKKVQRRIRHKNNVMRVIDRLKLI